MNAMNACTISTASFPPQPASRSVASAFSIGRRPVRDGVGRLTTSIVERGYLRAMARNARAWARTCSSQLAPGMAVNSMPEMTRSATSSSSAALLGTWL